MNIKYPIILKQIYILASLFIGLNTYCQTTYIPDDNFEQELINIGLDDVLDDYVLNENISDIRTLQLEDLDIYDLTGIEGFTSLRSLDLSRNFLTTLDISQNLNLELLDCGQINTLIELNIQNGNNHNFRLGASDCPNLICVQVDDIAFVSANINSLFFFYGTNNYTLTLNCATLATQDMNNYNENVIIYPNSSNDFIFIYGLTQAEQYKIYNSLGSNMGSGFLSNEKKIDIRHLTSGLYFLKWNNRNTLKFIKK